MAKKTLYALLGLVIIIGLIFAYREDQKTVEALKDNKRVLAKITQIHHEKIGVSYDVDYYFDGRPMHGSLDIQKDSIKVGDNVWIRVATKHPQYIVFDDLLKKK